MIFHMAEMSWKEAIIRVLTDTETPMSTKDITKAIGNRGYRTLSGKTPEATVGAHLTGANYQHLFTSPSKNLYALRDPSDLPPVSTVTSPSVDEQMGLINAFGMFWSRSEVEWSGRTPKLLGTTGNGGGIVNFSKQAGVYLLYDGSRVIYVGKVEQPRLGLRLAEHTRDRLSSRWDRFSWFGVRPVNGDKLGDVPSSGIGVSTLIATMEALLIEGLEPPQNRRQGDGFRAVEFLQQTDPELAAQRQWRELQSMFSKNFPRQ